MGYHVNFLDNQTVTSDDLNQISQELGGTNGTFQDDMIYGVDALNQISSTLIQKGVSRGCDLSLGEETVTIGPGVLYMSDGKRVEIDSEGILIPYSPGVKQYVWFMQNESLSFVLPQCTEEMPSGVDYVLLGEILPDGQISGYPDRAVMKHSFLGLNHAENHTVTYTWDALQLEERLMAEIPLEQVGCRYVVAYSNENLQSVARHHCFCGFVDLSAKTAFSVMSTFRGMSENFDMGFPQEVNQSGMLQVGLFPADSWKYCFGLLRFELGTDNVLRLYQSGLETSYGRSIGGVPKQVNIQLIIC